MKKGRPTRAATCMRVFKFEIAAMAAEVRGKRWPAEKWQKDPVGFVREELGAEPLDHQAEIMMAVAADPCARVTVRSGQKTGKTCLDIWLALWFYCSFPEAQVLLTATTGDQIAGVLWKQLNLTILEARKHGFEIETPPANPSNGMKAADFRSIKGISVREREALAGLSGKNQLFICDEASSLSQELFEAVEGNCAGGARIIMTSNPTKVEGPFFDSFYRMKDNWKQFHLSSEVIARKYAELGKEVRGIASLATLERWKEMYGADSALYIQRASGDFLLQEKGKAIDLHTITEAQYRWPTASDEGVLTIGIDPAGDGESSDEFAFCLVRGLKVINIFAFRSLSEESGLQHLLSFLASNRRGDETPRVIIDADGPIGSSFYGRLKAIAEDLRRLRPADGFEVFGVRASNYAKRQPQLYERVREELWANLAKWLKIGGSFPPDFKLEAELHTPAWVENTNGGKAKITSKVEFRSKLGRSPDRADALCLAVWEPMPWLKEDADPAPPPPPPERVGAQDTGEPGNLNPYASGSFGRGRGGGGFDPYAR